MRMIFHYPGPFYATPMTGEQRRPPEMARAFSENGIDVYTINGSAVERRRRWRSVKSRLSEFDFVYSENSTLPLRLVEPAHIPLFPSPDYALFRRAARVGVPCGVFYRDFYWRRHGFARDIGVSRYLLARHFYISEVRLYLNTMKWIFVPSKRLAAMLPSLPFGKIKELPPGGRVRELASEDGAGVLRVLYVGNARPPVYDLGPLIASVAGISADLVRLTLVIPTEARGYVTGGGDLPSNIEVLHVSGDKLAAVYARSDVAVMRPPKSQYARDTVALKLYEAVGFGVPVIGFAGTRCGELITEDGLGWSIEVEELPNLLRHLGRNRSEVQKKRKHVEKVRVKHSWVSRARAVVGYLDGN